MLVIMKKILLLFCLFGSILHSQTKAYQFNKTYFVENNNRIKPFNGTEVFYTAQLKNVEVWITNKGLIYNYYTISPVSSSKDEGVKTQELSRVEWERNIAEFEGASILKSSVQVTLNDLQINYLRANSQINCSTAKQLIFENIYPGIDWKIYFNNDNLLKQDYIVHPGADLNSIKISYTGLNPVNVQANSLEFKTRFGKFQEGELMSYQANSNLPSNFKKLKSNLNNGVNKTVIGFEVKNYNHAAELVIDPILNWCTFFGGNLDDDLHGISNDGTNTWVIGHTQSLTFPTSNAGSGAFFQGSYSGGAGDGFLLKFNNVNSLVHATYIGGTAGEEIMAIATTSNEVCISGFTHSTDFPLLNPGGAAFFQSTLSGANDGFIMKFNLNANLLWSTYVGGTVTEYLNALDYNNGNLFAGGVSKSANFPTLNSGTFFQSFVFDNDVVVMKFNASNAITWSTFMGGTGNDLVYSIKSNSTNLIVAGNTNSSGFNILNGGAYTQTAIAGSFDGFISKFNLNGVLQWSTFYGGNLNDRINSVYINNNVLWLTGTTSSTNLPVFNAGGGAFYQASNLGINDGFITKFSLAGTLKHSTYIGGAGNDYFVTMSGENDNIIVGGYTNSSTLTTLNDGSFYQGSNAGFFDVYLNKFDTSCVMQWSTYMGNASNDYIENIQCKNSRIYGAGYLQSSLFPTFNPGLGAYYQATGIGGMDGFIFEFKNCSNPTLTVTPTVTVCAGNNLTLTAISSTVNSFQWIGPAVYSSTNALAVVPAVTAANAGFYSIIVTAPGGCATSGNVNVTVNSSPTNTLNHNGPLCVGGNLSLTTNTAVAYLWTGPGSFSSTVQNPGISNVSLVNGGIYTLQATNSIGCTTTQTANIAVNGNPTVSVSGATAICEGASINLLGGGALNYTWTSPSNSISINNTLTINSAQSSDAGTYTVIGNTAFGCIGTATFSLMVSVCTSIEELNAQTASFAYSHQSRAIIVLRGIEQLQSLYLLDLQGKIIQTTDNTITAWPLGDIAEGLYFLRLNYKDGSQQSHKLIIYR